MHPQIPAAVARPEQLVHNAVYSGTGSRYAASGRRPGRGGPLAYRIALPQTLRLSGQFPGAQNNDEFRIP
jgi:hypothetical protein